MFKVPFIRRKQEAVPAVVNERAAATVVIGDKWGIIDIVDDYTPAEHTPFGNPWGVYLDTYHPNTGEFVEGGIGSGCYDDRPEDCNGTTLLNYWTEFAASHPEAM